MPAAFSPTRSFQWDLARQVERLDWLLAQLPRYAAWGYQELHLHLEDAVEYPSLPGVARRDAYSYKQFGRLVAAATRAGIKVVPIVNLLGHTQYLIKVPELRELNELRGPDGTPFPGGQICPLHPRTLEVAEKLLRDMAPFCTAGKVHVGLDESFDLGRHPLSRREIGRIGLAAHFARHVNRLHTLTRALGLRMGLWGDMLYFLPQAIPLLPTDVTVYEWYYYGFPRRPRVELFNFAEADIATPLRRRGIALYGCPMNGSARYEPLPHFSDRLENILSWWRHGRRIGAEGILVTSWEPFRLAMEMTTVVDAAAACLWLNPGVTEPQEMLACGFERVFGKKSARTAARVALASDRHPFGGYPRWQINDRWDTVSRREPLAPFHSEEKSCTRLAAARPLPAPCKRAWNSDATSRSATSSCAAPRAVWPRRWKAGGSQQPWSPASGRRARCGGSPATGACAARTKRLSRRTPSGCAPGGAASRSSADAGSSAMQSTISPPRCSWSAWKSASRTVHGKCSSPASRSSSRRGPHSHAAPSSASTPPRWTGRAIARSRHTCASSSAVSGR